MVTLSYVPAISALLVFYHEGISSFEKGIMISKFWRKQLSSSGVGFDAVGLLSKCFELSELFSDNVTWSKGSKAQIITQIQPKYVCL